MLTWIDMDDVVKEVETGELREAPLPSRSAVVRGLVIVVAIGALLPSFLGLLGRWGWLLDLCNHFRFQCLLVLFITTLGLLLLRSWRWAGVSMLGLVLNLTFVLPLYIGSPGDPATGVPFTVMHFNVNTGNSDHTGVIAEIDRHAPDLLFVQEVNRRWLDALETGLTDYELVVEDARTDNFGIACFVRTDRAIEITGSRAFDLTDGFAQIPVIEVSFTFKGRWINALSIHPLPPISMEYATIRDAMLEASGKWASTQRGPCIVVGDFNATPWSTAFRDMQSAGALTNSQVGYGRAPTWPAGLGSLGMIPIDHLLHSNDLVTVDRKIGHAKGSDHKPLVVTLYWRANER
ncbi:MAG: endonuclease/exonuclease/phosphatase family protein [Phycisphaeraceae bacterium]